MSSPSWTAPHWSHPPPPTASWNLLEIKQGTLLTTHPLTALSSHRRGCITFGRIDDPSIVDIVTAHESCSRLHARLAFDANGVPWLRDLGSNHGTFVNHVRLPREACGKMEVERGTREDGARGCRGVVVYPGDVFRFGASTRIFCLEGPEEYDRGKKEGERAQRKCEGGSLVAEEERDGHVQDLEQQQKQTVVECNWGMGEDDAEQDEENDNFLRARSMDPNLPSIEAFFAPSSKYTIPSSLQQLYKTQQTKQGKLRSLQIESQRIMQKEDRGVELTEGQTKQLEKNRERMEDMEKDLDELHAKIEEGIYGVIHGTNGNLGMKRRMQSRSAKEEDDVDDFYDRTVAANKKRRCSEEEREAESEQTLIQKWKLSHSSHREQLDRVSRALQKCQAIQSEINAIEDEEDAFFLRNDLTLANEELSKTKNLLASTEKEWSEVELLLKIVNPKLSWNRGDGWIGIGSERPEQVVDKQKVEVSGGAGTLNDVSVMMPPPPKINVGEATSSDQTESLDEKVTSSQWPLMPPSQSSPYQTIQVPPVVGPAMPHPPIKSQSNQETLAHPQTNPPATTLPKHKRQVGPSRPSNVVGTLAALHQAIHPQTNKEKSTPLDPTNKEKKLSAPIFDPRKDEWKAPLNQDGSGRTSLHDKFKGRY
ncbi:hypothetical protein HJC23_013021 [Cyclotella cryptica]|uniref:FHA domain-containing protein n=1 Tax=Cyclotella cryptica TaxID=29204 RepID=A0ABD3QIF0_9STRA|eukprot:CCRYP_005633-RA/>CCRYP_005633-RA protein AED:0.09 eAED:0.09 QI:0/-1/0/1/-1/1/1/0/649